jgi:hypothetical protein
MSEVRPIFLSLTDTFPPRIHNPVGPSLKFSDGTELYHWNNIEVTDYKEYLLDKSKITPELIDTQPNIEIRRCLLEMMGIDNYMLQSKDIKVLDEDLETIHCEDGTTFTRKRTLVQKPLPNDEVLTGVFVTNHTPNGQYSSQKVEWVDLETYSATAKNRLIQEYGNTEYMKFENDKQYLKVIEEHGEFIPEKDDKGNLLYKTYFLRVHPELRPLIDPEKRVYGEPQKMTCHNAVASTFGLRGEEYQPDVET